MDPGLLRDALTVALGVLTGIMSGLFGVGGAVISTPGIRALGVAPLPAIGTTLPSIIPGAASGTIRYRREGLVDWRVVAITAPAGIVASVLGALATDHVPGDGHLLMLLTAALLGYSAVRMFPRSSTDDIPSDPTEPLAETDAETAFGRAPSGPGAETARDPGAASEGRAGPVDAVSRPLKRGRLPFAGLGLIAGGLSGLLGIGGGIVMVPAFAQLADLPVKEAIATSLACVGLFAIPGTITHALQGNIDWHVALLLTVGVIPGARIGAVLAIRSGDARLRRVVAIFLGLMALAYGIGETIALFA